MKFPNVKTLAITAGVTAILLGMVIKSGREAVAAGTPAKDTVAGKLGFI